MATLISSRKALFKKTVTRKIIENGVTTEITTTVEEISGDNIDPNELLAKFDKLSDQVKSDKLKYDQNQNETVIKTDESKLAEVKPSSEIIKDLPIQNDNLADTKQQVKTQATGEDVKPQSIPDRQLQSLVDNNLAEPLPVDKAKHESVIEPVQLVDQQSKFNEDCLAKHNYYRSLHGVEPLTINNKLNELAQNWANHLATIGSLSHRPKSEYGENVFWTSQAINDGNKAVEFWYSEITKYNWDKATFVSGTGHFTQVIWKESRELGIGKASCSKGTFVVCNYSPAGNFLGKFKENVLPLIKK